MRLEKEEEGGKGHGYRMNLENIECGGHLPGRTRRSGQLVYTTYEYIHIYIYIHTHTLQYLGT